MSSRYWFRPKTYGYGATPVTWEGWVLTIGYVLVSLLVLFNLINNSAPLQLIPWVGLFAALTVAMIWLSKRKTEGEWRWRWGRANTGKT